MSTKLKLKKWWRLYKFRLEIYSILFFSIDTIIQLISCRWIMALHSLIYVVCIYVIFRLTITISLQDRVYKIFKHRLIKSDYKLTISNLTACSKCSECDPTCPISDFTACKFKSETDKQLTKKLI